MLVKFLNSAGYSRLCKLTKNQSRLLQKISKSLATKLSEEKFSEILEKDKF